jgi:hypothetical protein
MNFAWQSNSSESLFCVCICVCVIYIYTYISWYIIIISCLICYLAYCKAIWKKLKRSKECTYHSLCSLPSECKGRPEMPPLPTLQGILTTEHAVIHSGFGMFSFIADQLCLCSLASLSITLLFKLRNSTMPTGLWWRLTQLFYLSSFL